MRKSHVVKRRLVRHRGPPDPVDRRADPDAPQASKVHFNMSSPEFQREADELEKAAERLRCASDTLFRLQITRG